MEERGWTKILRDAGAVVANPGCGPCFGAHQGLGSERDTIVTTTNRNFPGRMGHRATKLYLRLTGDGSGNGCGRQNNGARYFAAGGGLKWTNFREGSGFLTTM
jgi:hypothetical protein